MKVDPFCHLIGILLCELDLLLNIAYLMEEFRENNFPL